MSNLLLHRDIWLIVRFVVGPILVSGVLIALSGKASAEPHLVCPVPAAESPCQFFGGSGFQDALDVAVDGDTIHLAAGTYMFEEFRDVPYREYDDDEVLDLIVRAGLVIDGKRLDVIAEDGAMLDGSASAPMSAFVLRNSEVRIRGLAIDGFSAAKTDDEVYDGHGVFSINSDVDLSSMTVKGMPKMAVAARGDSDVNLREIRLIDNHIGVWAEETSNVTLRNVEVLDTHVAAIAAYDESTVKVFNGAIIRSLDDGLYAKGNSLISVFDSILQQNAPYAARAVETARIRIHYSALIDNEEDLFIGEAAAVFVAHKIEGFERPAGDATRLQVEGDPNGRGAVLNLKRIGVLSD